MGMMTLQRMSQLAKLTRPMTAALLSMFLSWRYLHHQQKAFA
jgi:hypothetical protein